jgi:alkylated DNA repair dioxygenase AlkB
LQRRRGGDVTTLDDSAREILVDVTRGARVTYHPGYVPREEADLLLARMMDAPWQREAPVIFGKAREVRRRTCALGDDGLVYRYSGLDRVALPWPAELVALLQRLRVDFDRRLNFGLCNLYPDGDASIGKHADAESDIVRDSPIVGLSLGAERDFVLFESAGGREQRAAEVALEHGSVVVMWGSTQRFYKHAVPARRRCREPRVNITFRCLISDARAARSRQR